MEKVVIVDYLRSPFSRSRPAQPERDVYDKVYSSDMTAKLVATLVKRTKINAEEINDVITGCTMMAGEQMLLGGRIINLLAELP